MRVRVRVRRRPALDDEAGVTILIVTMSLLAICGMLVLVVDVGGLLTLRRRMVLSADAAALAAAQSCAEEKPAEAAGQADLLATENQSDATQESFSTTGCGTSNEGSVSVEYDAPKELVFASLLGYPDERPVGAAATAIWGPAGGVVGPMPVELSINPEGTIDCAFEPDDTQCAYWHDNNARQEWNNSSNWGWLNIDESDKSGSESCPNAGSDDRRDWIQNNTMAELSIEDDYTLVCADSGHSSSSWAELNLEVGTIRWFPVNDPARMVTESGSEKYAIIGFIPLRIDAVLKGNDPAAIGTPGASGRCSGTHSFTKDSSFDVDDLGCYGSASTVANLVLEKGNGSKKVTYIEGTDYTFDPNSHVITWFSVPAPDVSIEFDWAQAGSAGKCGSRAPDPNGICLVLSWQGIQVGGSLPGNGVDLGARAVQLTE